MGYLLLLLTPLNIIWQMVQSFLGLNQPAVAHQQQQQQRQQPGAGEGPSESKRPRQSASAAAREAAQRRLSEHEGNVSRRGNVARFRDDDGGDDDTNTWKGLESLPDGDKLRNPARMNRRIRIFLAPEQFSFLLQGGDISNRRITSQLLKQLFIRKALKNPLLSAQY